MRHKVTSARFIIPIDIYNADLYVSLGESDERFRQGLLRYKDSDWVEECVEFMDVKPQQGCGRMGQKDNFFLIRLGVFPNDAWDYGTLQHEIFHYVEFFFKHIGMPHHTKYSSEAYAYLIGYLTKQIYNRLW